jgi:hypothetical protein
MRRATSVALVVGVDDRVAALLAATAFDAGIGFVRVPHGPAACRAMDEVAPDLVVLPPTLWRDERESVVEAARRVGAQVLDVPTSAPPTWLALSFVRAATACETRRVAC